MSRPSIICTVTNDLNQDQRMHRVCTSLHKAGYEVTFVGLQKTDSLPLPNRPYKTVRLDIDAQQGPRFYYQYNQKLLTYLLAEQPSLVYAVDTDTLWACGRAKKRLGCKLILDAHEYFVEVPELRSRLVKKATWRAVERRYIPLTDARITVGKSLARVLSDRDGLPYEVVRNVPMLDHQIEKGQSYKKILLYQGVLNRGRGLEAAIECLSLLEDQSIELHLVGGGDIEQSLRQRAEGKGYGGRVTFRGWLHGQELVAATTEAWLGLNLLETDSLNYRYSLANKFFDYMHAGVPSINMRLPEYEAIISDYKVGMLLDDLSAADMAQAINCLTDADYNKMAKAAIEAKKNFHWEKEEAYLLSIVDTVLSHR